VTRPDVSSVIHKQNKKHGMTLCKLSKTQKISVSEEGLATILESQKIIHEKFVPQVRKKLRILHFGLGNSSNKA
jgi:hypothetical protein